MVRFIVICTLPLLWVLHADIFVYKGTIGKSEVKIFLDIPTTTMRHTEAFYLYTRYNTPIKLFSQYKTYKNNTLVLKEKDSLKKTTATISLPNFTRGTITINGTWHDAEHSENLPVHLKKIKQISMSPNFPAGEKVLLTQNTSLQKYYFKVLLTRPEGAYYPLVSQLRLYTKKDDSLFQSFNVEAQGLGFSSIAIEDYNFDGYLDFSLFESFYAGPNTSSLYFLYNPKTNKYFLSDISGINLEFDAKTKTITSRNSSQAGRTVSIETFTLENNQMKPLKAECLKLETLHDYKSYDIKECY